MTTSTAPRLVAHDLAWAPAPTAPLILDGVELSLPGPGPGPGFARHVALIGDNGSGKTTLARLLTGELMPTRGAVHREGRVGWLRQTAAREGQTVADGLGQGPALRALGRLLHGAGTAEDAEVVGDRWSLLDEAQQALAAHGLQAIPLDRSLTTLSGGEQPRVQLAALSLERADLWILDEPTNHLDRSGREALLELLETAPPCLIITHDDALLDRLDVVHKLRGGRLHTTRGGLAGFLEAEATERAAAAQHLKDAEKTAALTARWAQARREKQEQRDAAGRRLRKSGSQAKVILDRMKESAGQTRARTRKLDEERRETADAQLRVARERVTTAIDLAAVIESAALPAAKAVVEAHGLGWAPPVLDGKAPLPPVFSALDLVWKGPRRVGVVGDNGGGKSTLLDLLRGKKASTEGTLTVGVERVAFLDQHLAVPPPDGSVLDNLCAAAPSLPRGKARERLAAFLFWGDDVERPAAVLSGGERLRLALCCALAEDERGPPQLLLLDEPTNHLDRRAREGLVQMLTTWPGALVVVSHDVRFCDRLALDEALTLPSGERSAWPSGDAT